MIICVDTREHARKIVPIINTFDRAGVKYFSSKSFVGDYYDFEKPTVIIDRKQNIREIATNATTEHKRLNEELRRLDYLGLPMIFLITQSKIKGKKIENLEDIIGWEPAKGQGTVSGMTVYKILAAWKYKHNVKYVFCEPKEAGDKILEILEGGHEYYDALE